MVGVWAGSNEAGWRKLGVCSVDVSYRDACNGRSNYVVNNKEAQCFETHTVTVKRLINTDEDFDFFVIVVASEDEARKLPGFLGVDNV